MYFYRESEVNPNYLSASRTNENVIFGNGSTPEFVSSTPRRKKSSSKSPIDSTTQLWIQTNCKILDVPNRLFLSKNHDFFSALLRRMSLSRKFKIIYKGNKSWYKIISCFFNIKDDEALSPIFPTFRGRGLCGGFGKSEYCFHFSEIVPLLSSSIKRPGQVDPVFQLRKSSSNSSQTSPKESRKRRTFWCSTFSLVPNMMLNKVAFILLVLGLANARPKNGRLEGSDALKAVKT